MGRRRESRPPRRTGPLPISTHCRGCNGDLRPQRRGANPRQWCSEACRVATYRGEPRRRPPVELERLTTCLPCGRSFVATRRHSQQYFRRTCSASCLRATQVRSGVRLISTRSAPVPTPRQCVDCSAGIVGTGSLKFCPSCRKGRRRAGWRRKNAVRRGSPTMGVPTISIEQLGDRDRWRCHLCHRHVNRALKSPHPNSPTFDHLIPVSRGGPDTPENLRLAHRRCNCSRGTRGDVQLLLIG